MTASHPAVRAPDPAPDVAAWVGGRAIPLAELDRRLGRLRASDRACVLPNAQTREGRQLRRWVAQVLVVEQLCIDELAARGLGWTGDDLPDVPSRTGAVALGSIVAAAWSGHPAVRRAAQELTRAVSLSPAAMATARRVGTTDTGDLAWGFDELLGAARLDDFSRWLAGAVHDRVVLVPGLEHPGDSSQPDNLHRH